MADAKVPRGTPEFEAELIVADTMRQRAEIHYRNGVNAGCPDESLHVDDMEHFASRELERMAVGMATLVENNQRQRITIQRLKDAVAAAKGIPDD